MQNRIVLVGAGSASFGLGTIGDILKSHVLRDSTIVLHDINPEALAHVEGIARRYIQENNLPFQIEATIDRKAALQGAEFVVISIEVGNRFELWDLDWNIPQQYGIRQVYGENGGPGGLFHALRIIPPILEICGDIMQICPDAYVFNFSNPMTRICQTALRKYPDLKLIGLCHEVHSLPQHLPQILGTPLENLWFRAGGLNHFSVLLDVRYKDSGQDAYPDVRAKGPAYFARQPCMAEWLEYSFNPTQPLVRNGPDWGERTLFKYILEKFGYLPITSDSHFGEYISWAHEVVDHRAILEFYRSYQVYCSQKISDTRILGTGEEEGWNIVSMFESLVTGEPREDYAVNILNDGFIDNLPRDVVVEVPALIDSSGVHGVQLGALPKGIAGLMSHQVAVLDLTAEAVISCSRDLALQALLMDPVVHSARAAEQTLDVMLSLQKQWLGYLQ
jgi:alpha-galactosidase